MHDVCGTSIFSTQVYLWIVYTKHFIEDGMASEPSLGEGSTPKKSVLLSVCRCCNKSSGSIKTRVFLLGKKADDEKLLEKIRDFGGVVIKYSDMLPSHICKVCYSTVTTLEHKACLFRYRCKETEKDQLQSCERSKRERKENSPKTHATESMSPWVSKYVTMSKSPISPSVESHQRKKSQDTTNASRGSLSRRRLILPKPRQLADSTG